MSLTESIVDDDALTWFGELGYSCLGAEALAPTLSQGERESYGEVVLVGAAAGELAAVLNTSTCQSRTLTALRDTLVPKLLSGELSVAHLNS